MIKDFLIKNYRRFSEFRLSGLGQVNIFVGRNNAGKTSLLEALYIHSMGMDIETLQSIAIRRGELAVDVHSPSQCQVDYAHFFNGHKIKPGLVVQLGTESNNYKMKVSPYADSELMQGVFALDSNPTELDTLVQSVLTITQDRGDKTDRRVCEVSLTSEGVSVRSNRYVPASASSRNRICFISPDSLDNSMLSSLWNKVQLANKETDIIRALQILEPKARKLAFLLPEQMGRYIARPLSGVMIGLDGHSRKIPLGSLGDGMKRLLAIALALACSKGGALFIDEVDAGFHYSVMKDLWKLVIKTAIDNNVQVFVTTHSLDCLKGLSVLDEFAEPHTSSVSLYSVREDMDEAVHYNADEIEKIIANEIEVR